MSLEVVPLTFISEVEMVWLPSASNISNTSRAFLLRDRSARLSAVSCYCNISDTNFFGQLGYSTTSKGSLMTNFIFKDAAADGLSP